MRLILGLSVWLLGCLSLPAKGSLAGDASLASDRSANDGSVAASCNNQAMDGLETDVDCGGPCGPCADGRGCSKQTDCASGLCVNNLCARATCKDRIRNQDETDVDCGGARCPPCAILGDCNDRVPNQDETDVDCGGVVCTPCANDQSCLVRSDCTSANCSFNRCCGSGFGNCDGQTGNGCEVNLNNDTHHCGACGSPCANGKICQNGVCAIPTKFWVSGVQSNLAVASLSGWTLCHRDAYASGGKVLGTITTDCSAANLLMGCGRKNSGVLTLAAMAARADVLLDTGAGPNATHSANGVAWYFGRSSSWGFAPEGDVVSRRSCDVTGIVGFATPGADVDLRLCWHTSNNTLVSGFRCGATDLNGDLSYERVVYQAD